jgi:hypothetical protein
LRLGRALPGSYFHVEWEAADGDVCDLPCVVSDRIPLTSFASKLVFNEWVSVFVVWLAG